LDLFFEWPDCAIRILSGFVQASALSLVTSDAGKFWANDGAQHASTPSRPKTNRIVDHSFLQWRLGDFCSA